MILKVKNRNLVSFRALKNFNPNNILLVETRNTNKETATKYCVTDSVELCLFLSDYLRLLLNKIKIVKMLKEPINVGQIFHISVKKP